MRDGVINSVDNVFNAFTVFHLQFGYFDCTKYINIYYNGPFLIDKYVKLFKPFK